MPTISDPIVPAGAPRPRAERIWCGICGTNEHVILDSIEPLKPPMAELVDIAYTCVECDTFYAHAATFQDVAMILNQRGTVTGVLQFGGEYIHCGEPMKISGTGFHSVYAPMSTEDPAIDLLDVYLATKVLKCRCGFRMELPS
ncbi:hypothetical protein [Arthrobacter sp. MMS24-S77]